LRDAGRYAARNAIVHQLFKSSQGENNDPARRTGGSQTSGGMIMRRTLLLAAGMLLAAHGAALADAGKPKICFVTFSLQIAYFQSSVSGGKEEAAKQGAELIVFDPQADSQKQVTMVEDCIAQKVDAIVMDPIESGSLAGVIEDAGKKGMKIAVLDTPIQSPYVTTQIGVPQFEASREFGQMVAGYVLGKMGGQANVGIMLASTEVQLARRDGFLEAMKAVPGVKVVGTGDGRNILERATAEAEDMLTAHPEINVIYATGDPQLQGGLAAAASQGKQIAFFGWDDIPAPFIKPLEDGIIVGFMKQKPEVGGMMAVRLLSDAVRGKEVPAQFKYSPDIVTQQNLDQFR
jgi:ABC-type sugar transport system substrate-binding protein